MKVSKANRVIIISLLLVVAATVVYLVWHGMKADSSKAALPVNYAVCTEHADCVIVSHGEACTDAVHKQYAEVVKKEQEASCAQAAAAVVEQAASCVQNVCKIM